MDENLVLKTHQETTDDPITDQQFNTACIIAASGLTGIVTGLVTGLIFKHRLKRRLELENIHKKRELDLMEKRLKEQEENLIKIYDEKARQLQAEFDERKKELEKDSDVDTAYMYRSRTALAEKAIRLNDAIEQISKTQTAQEAMDVARDLDIEGMMNSILGMDNGGLE